MTIIDSPAASKTRAVTPFWYGHVARAASAGILLQYLLAGLGLFHDGRFWSWHGGLGLFLLLPIAAMGLAAWLGRAARPLRWWAGLLAVLYLGQVASIAIGKSSGSGVLQALHPFNGGLMLAVSLVLLAKVERNRARAMRAGSA